MYAEVRAVVYSLGTPSGDDHSKPNLLGVVSDIRSKTKYSTPVVTIRALNNLWSCHPGFEGLENECKAFMEELSTECLEFFRILFIAAGFCRDSQNLKSIF